LLYSMVNNLLKNIYMEPILKQVNVKLLTGNFFKMLDNDWMLITAGTKDSFNTMTASWGSFGMLWNKPIAIGFIRPQRHTFEFVNTSDAFTLCFFTEKYRDALNYCGSHSGRSVDKISGSGLTTASTKNGNVYFPEAKLVFECKKMYSDDLKQENFIQRDLVEKIYPKKDFHRFFIGEITSCLSIDAPSKDLNLPFEEFKGNSI
jgi:flavin reductase (DIM6/NTAB) family NADH-FMN oxidoreductase RutF